ncbi:hypothetical protein GIB67_042070 [Kingdonia uniflora]|uniref:Uncharacterized protein n=1 Tax=Kingdonia uniflora TaxID=39325 RepID=A0A7J7MVM2_9MAGN|nr:hypothetical protein GIB67_042070 [Kingdonia uniflora]
MKSDKEVNEQFDEKNQTHEVGAKRGTSIAKNYTSRCIGAGFHKIFVAMPEEKKGVLRNTCFAPLLFIDPITTMSTLVIKIFDRHLSDMKFQFRGTIIQMKPINVYMILGLHVSSIVNEFLFVDPEHITNFRMRRFPKKMNTYGLKEIDRDLKQAKLERYHDDVLRLNLLKIILSFLFPNKGKNVEVRNHIEAPAVGAPAVDAPAIGSSSSATEIKAIVAKVCSQLEEHVVKDLMVDKDVKVGRKVNLEAISSEYGGGLLEWKNGDKKVNDVEKDGEEKAKSEEEQHQVVEEEDSEQQTIVVYYNGKKMYNMPMRYLLKKRVHNLKLPDYN